jgi:uncharacterized membrane protein YdjX (TVP38/TMEM64 family)
MMEQLQRLPAQVNSVDFWAGFFTNVAHLGPLVPMLLAAVESIFPPLPLIGVVTFNVMSQGALRGFLYSWLGTSLGSTAVFLFFRWIGKKWLHDLVVRSPKGENALAWVVHRKQKHLFLVSCMPFTPSAFVNFAFGIAEFDAITFLMTIYPAKAVMVGIQVLFGTSLVAGLERPWLLLVCGVLVALFYFISKLVGRLNGLK